MGHPKMFRQFPRKPHPANAQGSGASLQVCTNPGTSSDDAFHLRHRGLSHELLVHNILVDVSRVQNTNCSRLLGFAISTHSLTVFSTRELPLIAGDDRSGSMKQCHFGSRKAKAKRHTQDLTNGFKIGPSTEWNQVAAKNIPARGPGLSSPV